MAYKNLRQDSKTAIETKISNSGLKDIKPKAEPRQKRESRGVRRKPKKQN